MSRRCLLLLILTFSFSDQFKINLLFFVQLALTYASHSIAKDFNRLGERGNFLLQFLLPEFAYPFLLNCEISIPIPSELWFPDMKNNYEAWIISAIRSPFLDLII